MKSFLVSHELKQSFLNVAGVASVPPEQRKGSAALGFFFFFSSIKIAWVAIKLVI